MAEQIGDAFVEVYFEGDGPRARASKKKIEGDAKRWGKSAGEKFADGMDDGVTSGQRKSAVNIRRSFDKMRWADIGDGNGAVYGKALTSRIAKNLRESLSVERAQNALERSMIASMKRVDKEQQRLLADRSRRTRIAARGELAEWQNAYNALDREAKENAASQVRAQRDTERDFIASYQRLGKAHSDMISGKRNRDQSYRDSIRSTLNHIDELRRALSNMPDFESGFGGRRNEYVEFFDDAERSLVRISPRLHLLNRRLDTTGTFVGRAFGRGSRSDLVNFFGGLAEGGFRAVTFLPRMVEGFAGVARGAFNTFSTLRQSQGVFQALTGTLSGGAKGLSSFGAAMASMAVAIPVVILVVGTLVAAMSMLLGVVTALAASLTFALGGALVAVAGLLGPVAAGVGVLVAAIASMSDAQKAALKTAIQPFVKGVKEIGSAAADTIFGGQRFTKTIDDMTKALTSSQMKDLVIAISDAIGDVGASWAASLNSEGFRRWLVAMGETVPGQIRDLGNVARNVIGGLGGFFLAAQPFITQFTGWLSRITAEFSAWANSDEGRASIVRFLDRAKESAKSVGEFLGQVLGLITDLFDAGKESGDSIFDGMADAIARFREYIADGKVEQWFSDAKSFASGLGTVISALARIFDALDNSVTRIIASGALWQVTTIFSAIGTTVEFVIGVVSKFAGAVLSGVGAVIQGLGELGGLIAKIPGVPDSFGQSWRDAGQRVKELGYDLSGISVVSDTAASKFMAAGSSMRSDASATNQSVGVLREGLDGVANNFFTAKINEQGASATTQSVGVLREGLDGVANNFFTAKVGETGSSAAKGQVFSLFTSLQDINTSFTAKIQQDGAQSAKTQLDNLIRSLNSINGKTYSYGIRGAILAKTAAASGGLALGNGTLATASRMAGGGGILRTPQKYRGVMTAEAGSPELIVPTRRPLHMVDPLVRPLSAIAQGMAGLPTNSKPQKIVDQSGWTIVTPGDPRAAAQEVANKAAGVGN